MPSRHRMSVLVAGMMLAAAGGVGAASAGLFHHGPPKPKAAAVDDATVAAVQQALDENRLIDAGRLIDRAFLANDKDPRLILQAGELDLAREQFSEALAQLKLAEAD